MVTNRQWLICSYSCSFDLQNDTMSGYRFFSHVVPRRACEQAFPALQRNTSWQSSHYRGLLGRDGTAHPNIKGGHWCNTVVMTWKWWKSQWNRMEKNKTKKTGCKVQPNNFFFYRLMMWLVSLWLITWQLDWQISQFTRFATIVVLWGVGNPYKVHWNIHWNPHVVKPVGSSKLSLTPGVMALAMEIAAHQTNSPLGHVSCMIDTPAFNGPSQKYSHNKNTTCMVANAR